MRVEGFAVKESFAEGNLPKRDLQWEDYVVVGFASERLCQGKARAKLAILRARKRQGIRGKQAKLGGSLGKISLGRFVIGRVSYERKLC